MFSFAFFKKKKFKTVSMDNISALALENVNAKSKGNLKF